MGTLYDGIGDGYDTTRKADSGILQKLKAHLAPVSEGLYLDVACGSGNYTLALAAHGCRFHGIDVSEQMLAVARAKLFNSVMWSLQDASHMTFEDDTFSGACCVLAIHHFTDLLAVFREVYRTLHGGRLVIFSSTAGQMHRYWLNRYFPKAMAKSIVQMPSVEAITSALRNAGFAGIALDPFFVTDEIDDIFLYSGKHRPHIYLNPRIRAGISTFASLCTLDEVTDGCSRLSEDIESGRIYEVIDAHLDDGGDYMFIVAEKLTAV